MAGHPTMHQLTLSPAVMQRADSRLTKSKETANLNRRYKHLPGAISSARTDPDQSAELGRAGQHPLPVPGNQVPAGPGHRPAVWHHPGPAPLPTPERWLSTQAKFNLVNRRSC